MSATHRPRPARRSRGRLALHALVVVALLAASGWLTVQLQEREATAEQPPLGLPIGNGGNAPAVDGAATAERPAPGTLSFSRLSHPDRTIARDQAGDVVATFTDGAKTAVLAGPARTFSEPETTHATVTTDSWVRLLPEAWTEGAEEEDWAAEWLETHLGSDEDDILAFGMQYRADTEDHYNDNGTRYRGPAQFGPFNEENERLEQNNDFYDYLGIGWDFGNGVIGTPEERRYGYADCSGFVRLVYGYRGGLKMLKRDQAADPTRLPRTAELLATVAPGAEILPLTGARPTNLDALQAGDLVFFELGRLGAGRMDHVGIYLGLDSDGKPRFLSSREGANGPTMGDVRGVSLLTGEGLYPAGFRSAVRL